MKDKILRTAEDENTEANPLPVYPAAEDIYYKDEKVENLDPEELTKNKTPNQDKNNSNQKDFSEDLSGDDLDIPGAELDDEAEATGSEDEENNYYSIGGDNHNDLDEDKAE